MWCVPRPNVDAGETFETCISNVRDLALRGRLAGIKTEIIAAATDYSVRATAQELHLIAQQEGVGGTVTTAEMVGVYDQKLAAKQGPGRSIYSALKLLPSNDRCPYCDHRDVSTLDHVLPKALFPTLAVTPDNLVGCCKDCNKAKLASAPTSAADTVLHPYFDDVSSLTWLRGNVVENDPCAVLFRVVPQTEWSTDLNARLLLQFEILGLGRLYSQQAARELSGIRKNLIRLFEMRPGGSRRVRRELLHQWESRRDDSSNSWQAATYRALSLSDWFCEGGFTLGI